MHTVDLLEQALTLAQRLGYTLRHEWLGENAGGPCEIKGQKWLFVNLALDPQEMLEQVTRALRDEGNLDHLPMSPALRQHLGLRKSA